MSASQTYTSFVIHTFRDEVSAWQTYTSFVIATFRDQVSAWQAYTSFVIILLGTKWVHHKHLLALLLYF